MTEFIPFSEPTPDWLDVTFSPNENPSELFSDFVAAHGLIPSEHSNDIAAAYRFLDPDTNILLDGVLQVSTKHRAYRLSCSGQVLDIMRSRGIFNQYLTLLASCPYRVTRLDVALDIQQDAADVLEVLDSRYPREVSLSRQRPLSTKAILSRRLDGRRSGTWYAGHRSKSRVTARVYDKTLEVFDRTGISYSPPQTRYELTFRDGVANLNDAYAPSGIFWAHSGSLLPAPPDCPLWSPSDVPAWTSERVEVIPYQALLRRVSASSELDVLASLADRIGPEGANVLLHLIAKRLKLDVKGQRFIRAA